MLEQVNKVQMDEQLNDLQREWRAIVLSKLNSLESGQSKLASDIVEIKTSFVHQTQYQAKIAVLEKKNKDLEDKIDELEKFKIKLVAVVLTLQTVGFGILWLMKNMHL